MWLEIIKLTKEFVGDLIKSSEVKKEKVSDLLSQISDLLLNVVVDLENDNYPHFSCSMMQSLTKEFHEKVKVVLEKEKSDYLENLLIQSSYLEREFALRKDPDTIIKLKEAAGEFKSISILLKV